MPSEIALLPCPFCGAKAELFKRQREIAAGDMGIGSSAGYTTDNRVRCSHCGAQHWGPSEWSPINWNSRAPDKRQAAFEACVAALKAVVNDGKACQCGAPYCPVVRCKEALALALEAEKP